jgi:hypothetical protein
LFQEKKKKKIKIKKQRKILGTGSCRAEYELFHDASQKEEREKRDPHAWLAVKYEGQKPQRDVV